MNQTLDIFRISRESLLKYFKDHSLAQLNKIPEGYNNNLIWNIAHVIVTQQLLVYKLSGLPMKVSDALIDKYRNGTKPTKDVTPKELKEIEVLLSDTHDQTKKDYENQIFKNFQDYSMSTGFVLKKYSRCDGF